MSQKSIIPEELLCGICKGILKEAVFTPCCASAFCHLCIVDHFIKWRNCSNCLEIDVPTENLIPNRYLRKMVQKFNEKTASISVNFEEIKSILNFVQQIEIAPVEPEFLEENPAKIEPSPIDLGEIKNILDFLNQKEFQEPIDVQPEIKVEPKKYFTEKETSKQVDFGIMHQTDRSNENFKQPNFGHNCHLPAYCTPQVWSQNNGPNKSNGQQINHQRTQNYSKRGQNWNRKNCWKKNGNQRPEEKGRHQNFLSNQNFYGKRKQPFDQPFEPRAKIFKRN